MKVLLVSGSYPPEVCGIGHYTYCLARALEEAGAEVEILTGPGWGPKRFLRLLLQKPLWREKLVHIQYPSEGYSWSVAPQALAMLRPSVITVHEFSRVHILRKFAIMPLLLFGKRLIFTSATELEMLAKRMPWIAGKSTVIEIGSNIPAPARFPARRLDEIVYFGLVAPNKGIEQVLELAALLAEKKLPVRVRIIGATVPRFRAYASLIRQKGRDLPVDWDADLDDEQTSRILARAAVAYLPFPDGASIRRGSLKALLANGVAVVTKRGAQTSPTLASTVLLASSPAEALDLGLGLLHHPERLERMSAAGRRYSEMFSWPTIARDHLELYGRYLGMKEPERRVDLTAAS